MSKFQTQAEKDILADIAAQEAAGGDPFGDDEPIVKLSIADQAAEAKEKLERRNGVTTEATGEDGETAIDADAATGTETADDTQSETKTEPGEGADAATTTAAETTAAETDEAQDEEDDEPPLLAADPAKLAQDANTLRDQKDALFEKFADGHIDAKAYNAENRKLDSQLEQIVVQRALTDANRQSVFNYQKGILNAIAAEAKRAGTVDYADPTAQADYNEFLNAIGKNPANSGRNFRSIAKEAHEKVLSYRGLAKPAAAAAAPAPAAPRVAPKAPVTLRNLPSAATPNSGGSVLDNMAKLTGTAYQEAYAKLTPAQKAALTD